MCGKIDDKAVKGFWDGRSKGYGKVSNESITLFAEDSVAKKRTEIELEKIDEYIDFSEDKKILDVGCGVGRVSMHVSKNAEFVLGVDYSEPLLKIGRELLQKNGIKNVEFLCGSCADFHYNKMFDLVIINAVILYLNDEEVLKTASNISNHLKVGGKLIVKESVATNKRFEVIDKYSEELKTRYNAIYRTPEALNKIFGDHKFKMIHSEKLYQHHEETATWFFVYTKENGK